MSSTAIGNQEDTTTDKDEGEVYRRSSKASFEVPAIQIDKNQTMSSRREVKYDDNEEDVKPRAGTRPKKKRKENNLDPAGSVPRNDPEVISLLDED